MSNQNRGKGAPWLARIISGVLALAGAWAVSSQAPVWIASHPDLLHGIAYLVLGIYAIGGIIVFALVAINRGPSLGHPGRR